MTFSLIYERILCDLLTGFWETKTWLQIEIHKETNNNKNELDWMV